MLWTVVTPALLAGLGVALWAAPAPERPPRPGTPAAEPAATPSPERVRRARLVWPAACLLVGWFLWPGWGGVLLGAGGAVVVHRVAGGAEPLEQRRERAAVRSDLPLIVLFLATAVRAGASTTSAVRQAAAALPGPAADRLLIAADRLALGVPPGRVWETLAGDPELGAVGRALARAERTGAAVAVVVERLADDLAGAARAEVEDRARAVGVRAAVPLGVCLLPSFLLLGIVPLVAALVDGLRP